MPHNITKSEVITNHYYWIIRHFWKHDCNFCNILQHACGLAWAAHLLTCSFFVLYTRSSGQDRRFDESAVGRSIFDIVYPLQDDGTPGRSLSAPGGRRRRPQSVMALPRWTWGSSLKSHPVPCSR